MSKNVVKEKSLEFALAIIQLNKKLTAEKEFVISNQLLRSGTSIGALIRESEHAESKQDFIHKLSIALKETNETIYWLELILKSNENHQQEGEKLILGAEELIRLLISIIKTSKVNLKK